MEQSKKIVENFKTIFAAKVNETELFQPAKEEQYEELKNLFGEQVTAVLDFYKLFQPVDLPLTDSYVKLLDIDSIIEENMNSEQSRYLADFGVYTFALTVGGNILCIDVNDCVDGDPVVLIADSSFCSYNEDDERVEIDMIPESVEEDFDDEEYVELNYVNIRKCLGKIEDSFMTFMDKLSQNKYEDIEEFLPE